MIDEWSLIDHFTPGHTGAPVSQSTSQQLDINSNRRKLDRIGRVRHAGEHDVEGDNLHNAIRKDSGKITASRERGNIL
jgi:hypothetical protein